MNTLFSHICPIIQIYLVTQGPLFNKYITSIHSILVTVQNHAGIVGNKTVLVSGSLELNEIMINAMTKISMV